VLRDLCTSDQNRIASFVNSEFSEYLIIVFVNSKF